MHEREACVASRNPINITFREMRWYAPTPSIEVMVMRGSTHTNLGERARCTHTPPLWRGRASVVLWPPSPQVPTAGSSSEPPKRLKTSPDTIPRTPPSGFARCHPSAPQQGALELSPSSHPTLNSCCMAPHLIKEWTKMFARHPRWATSDPSSCRTEVPTEHFLVQLRVAGWKPMISSGRASRGWGGRRRHL